MFDMAKVSKVMENADGASPTSTDDKLPAIKDDGKLNKLPPKANSGESKCKSVPCARCLQRVSVLPLPACSTMVACLHQPA
jgi:hypothetical protein